MTNCYNAYAYVTRCSRSFCTAVRYPGPFFNTTLTERRSFYAYRIYLRKFFWYSSSDGDLFYSVSGRSPYLPAAIVRVRNLFGAGTDSHKQSAVALTAFGEFLPSGTPRN